jgi:enoyl-CoA hydratase
MMRLFAHEIQKIADDETVKALVLTGEGGAFCAGGDLVELHTTTTHADGEALASLMGDAILQLSELMIPTIAAIEGPAIGGGAEIALACDLRIASTNAKIGFPQIKLALTPAWGGAGRLIQLVGYPTTFSLLTSGDILDSQQALDLGLIQRITPDGQALGTAIDLAHELSTVNATVIRALKTILRAHSQRSHQEARKLERSFFADLWASEAHIAQSEAILKRKDSR